MESLMRAWGKWRGRERAGSGTWINLVGKVAAVVCAALLMAESCKDRITYVGLTGSPGGKYLALYYPDDSEKLTRFYLFPGDGEIKNLDGALFSDELGDLAAQDFLSGASSAGAPLAFSPDNKFLAYVNETTGNYELHELDLGSMQSRVLFPHPAKDCSQSYSPDGKYLAFVSYRSGSGQAWLWDRETDKLRQVTHEPESIEAVLFAAAGKLFLPSAGSEDAGRILDLESNEMRPLPQGAFAMSFYPEHGLMILGSVPDYKDTFGFSHLTLYDVDKRTGRELGFKGEVVGGLSLPISPDGKQILAASNDAIWAVPLDGGTPLRFEAPAGLIDVLTTPFLAWLPGGKSFRLLVSDAQFTAGLADGPGGLRAEDQFAQSLLAISDLAQGRDQEFTARAKTIEALPGPLKMERGMTERIDLVRVITYYAAGQYDRAAAVWKDSDDAESRVLALYIGLLGKTPEQFRAGRKEFIEGLSGTSADEIKGPMKGTDFVDGLSDRQVRALQKYMKPLLAEHLDVMACKLADKCARKPAPETKKIGWYIRLHPAKPLSGYLATELSDICEAYGDTAEEMKYLRLASKSPEFRLQSLTQLSSSYSRHDPAAALKINETIMAEFPGTGEAQEAREQAGKYWLKQGDDGKAYELLSPLVLDADSAAPWQELKIKSETDFRDLVLAQYEDDDTAKIARLAKVADLEPEDAPNQVLLGMSEKIITDSVSSWLYDKTCHASPALEKLSVYCILNDPPATTTDWIDGYFYFMRRNEPAADIGSRWAGYAAAHPTLANTYVWLTLQGLLEYDQHNYAAARTRFEQARSALGAKKDEFEEEKKMTEAFILVCLARESSKELVPRLAATVSKDSRDVYEYTLAANLHKRPLPEISAFYLASRTLQGPFEPYWMLECRADENELKEPARDFTAAYPQSPLTAAVLFALEDYDAVIRKFPDMLAGYSAMQKQAENYDHNANYWLAAGLREKLLRHPWLAKEDKAGLLLNLAIYEADHVHDYKKAAALLARAEKEKPGDDARKQIVIYQVQTWYELKDLAKARESLALLDREYPNVQDDKLDRIRKDLAVPRP
ncbi:MAG TPA: hypothetical protein VM658_19385 [bacterium]|nr:hypothetical protein [bacterium]